VTTDNELEHSVDSEIIEITDRDSGSVARVLVSQGFNCFSWRPVLSDGPREVLWAEPGFEAGDKRPSGSGIPLLFPFPGRIGGARFRFDNREYLLEPGDAFGNAIHGFVYSRPWRVVEQSDSRVVGEFRAARDDPSILDRWPADFRIRVCYVVRGSQLVSDVRYENTGNGPLPCGFGTHAYLRLPLAERGDPEQTRVLVPATQIWESHEMLPTGRRRPANGQLNLTADEPLARRKFDTYFTDLRADSDGLVRTVLRDETPTSVVQSFDRAFTQCVVYTPPHRQAICLEPYTCIPDPFRLADAGLETGLQILQPGEVFETRIGVVVSC
jgi:aldose 1-epimerase